MAPLGRVFLIGAQKAGTTFLATLLGQHPEICLADLKEPDFFTKNWEKGECWYRERFLQAEQQWLLDASPSYSAAPLSVELSVDGPPSRMAAVPQRIAEFAPNARFIYMMRDPVKRTYSAYWHSVRAGDEKRPFAEAIRDGHYLLRMGCYHYQLQRYLDYFDRDRFLLLFFEDFIRHPEQTANACCEWLKLEPLENFEVSDGKNETYTHGQLLRLVSRLLASVGGLRWLSQQAKRIVPHAFLHTVRGTLTNPIPPMSEEDREWLARYFAEPNARLEQVFGLTLPGWTHPDGSSAEGGRPNSAASPPVDNS